MFLLEPKTHDTTHKSSFRCDCRMQGLRWSWKRSHTHTGGIAVVAFAKKSDNFFVSGSSDRTPKVWSLDDLPDDVNDSFILKSQAVKAVHDKDTNAVAIAPTGLLSTGSQDHTT